MKMLNIISHHKNANEKHQEIRMSTPSKTDPIMYW